jgi:hypothetical protein
MAGGVEAVAGSILTSSLGAYAADAEAGRASSRATTAAAAWDDRGTGRG